VPDLATFVAETDAENAGIDLVAEGVLPPRPQHGRPPADVAEAGEIYLELASLKLDDEQALLDFANRYGTLGVGHNDYRLFERLPGFQEQTRGELARSWPNGRRPAVRDAWLANPGPETLAEFRFGARVIRDLITAWEIVRDREQPWVIPWESIPLGFQVITNEERDAWQQHGRTLNIADEADRYLRETLNRGLEPFHPRLIDADLLAKRPDHVATHSPLYSVLCLELYNHILERADYRACQNENCQRTFVRQTGRAEHGQHRTEGRLLYCSKHCARAQAQRKFRRRQKAKTVTRRDPKRGPK
jgi:hypothetical protein